MATNTIDDVASGSPERRLAIAGRPRQGKRETYVLLEEPGDPVLMHFRGRQVPHFVRNCPNCGEDEPRPLWYVGAIAVAAKELVIVELTDKCFRSASAASWAVEPADGTFRGLLVEISRSDFARSPRVLRCGQRVTVGTEWSYQTRHELARIWGIPTKPRLFKEA